MEERSIIYSLPGCATENQSVRRDRTARHQNRMLAIFARVGAALMETSPRERHAIAVSIVPALVPTWESEKCGDGKGSVAEPVGAVPDAIPKGSRPLPNCVGSHAAQAKKHRGISRGLCRQRQ
jgi:hypothetical protein